MLRCRIDTLLSRDCIVEVGGFNNTIGGSISGVRNIISDNSGDGVLIDGTAANNLIQGNDVGTDYTGQNVLANSGNGVEIAGSNNSVGGSVSGAGNVIANNGKEGVLEPIRITPKNL